MQDGYVTLRDLEQPEAEARRAQPPDTGLPYSSGRFRNGASGLCNIGPPNCLNTLLQSLYMNKDFTDLLCRIGDPEDDVPTDRRLPYELLALFREMQKSKEDAVAPYSFLRCLQSLRVTVQAKTDVAEVFSALLGVLLQTVADPRLEEKMRALFTIPLEERVTCQRCFHQRSAPSDLLTIPIRVARTKFHRKLTLERELWKYFRSGEIPEEDNRCPQCERNSKGVKVTQLRSLPRRLSIHLKRLSLKNARQMEKVNRPVSFPPRLNLQEVLDPEHLPPAAGQAEAPGYNYRLFAVVAHSGTASLGHFCAYITSHKDGRWYFFNDSSVCQVSWDDVKCTYGKKSFQWGVTACLLVYTQEDSG